jgi:DNA-binding transcriptional LysR family regulator
VLAEADALEGFDTGSGPRGLLTLTAPVAAGADILRPVLQDFLSSHLEVRARLLLLDRPANLVEEGFDAALRIAHLPDSSLVAIRLGAVGRIACAAPAYLADHPPPSSPADLVSHTVIGLAETRQEHAWTFAGGQTVRLEPRIALNSIAAARAAAIDGVGVVRLLTYQAYEDIRAGRLEVLLQEFEPPPLPVHLIAPKDRLSLSKTRAFVDFAVPRLRAAFTRGQ